MFQCKYEHIITAILKHNTKQKKSKTTMKLIMNGYCLLVSDIIFIFIFYGWVTLCWNNEIYLINRLWGTPSIGTIWVYKIQRFTCTSLIMLWFFFLFVYFLQCKILNRKNICIAIYDGRGHCYCCSETKKNLLKWFII